MTITPAAVADPAAVDLTNCDREPIHIPGAILPHGAMLVIDLATWNIVQAAGDSVGLLGRPLDTLVGAQADNLFSAEQMDKLRALIADNDLIKPRHLLNPFLRVSDDRPLDASVHKTDGLLVIEVEQADPADVHAQNPLGCVQEMLHGLDAIPTLDGFCQAAAQRVKQITGYDRVMVYRFLEDGAGWVFAESREERLEPFLDLHYPASDIPKQARALYLQNWLRLITQVDYEPARLVPTDNPVTGKPLDMSQALLRDVSPIHREYLRNMGVDASMSISIIREGKLWGLFACHHYSPRRLPRHLRAVCELFGSMFSLQLEARERAEQFEARLASRKVLQQLMHNLADDEDYGQGLIRNTPNLLDYIQAGGRSLRETDPGGVAVRVNNAITSLGRTPTDDQIAALTDWLTQKIEDSGDGIFVTDRLGEEWPEAKAYEDVASGLLAVSVSRDPRDFILWFRPEVVENVNWGGNPTKPVEVGPNGIRLTPRKSFEVWTETVRGRATPWNLADKDAAFDLRVSLLDVVLRRIEVANRERERAYQQERLLMAELDHRVKNTLANISALISQTSRSAHSLTDFATGLNRRIQSMAKAHSLLTKSRWEGVNLLNLIREEIDHFNSGDAGMTMVGGPDVLLAPKAALSLSLALHELTTNAAKYGALSVHSGRLSLRWQLTAEGGLALEWRETGGPAVQEPKRRGFGTTLIQRALSMETGGRSEVRFEPGGVACDIFLPPAAIARASGYPVEPVAEKAPPPAPPQPELARRILVVEDSSLVIMTMEGVMEDLGWEMVGPATRVDRALELAASEDVDAALLDVNLDGEMSWDIARILRERKIPFVFTTGYDGSTVLPDDLADVTILSKPFTGEDIERQLRLLL
ncbi:HWE histidine kinase domain-containing protein [Sphingomonas humi]|uniref:histidine kinase n=1 Tax=Sphingomonas humi TaxID=335630 RepID=A0ABP7RFC6_9SPHN